jgi:flagellar protein FliS
MTNAQLLRNRYVTDAVETMSPIRLVTMLYDALVVDLVQAEASLSERPVALETAHRRLVHAQEIVHELAASLDPTAWEGGPELAALYAFVIDELISANVAKDAARVRSCRELVEPLASAWHEAAGQAALTP